MGRTLLVASCALLAGCGSTAWRYADSGSVGAPAWTVNGEDAKHPRESWLVGLGHGDTQQAADDAARAEISKVFEVRVHGTTGQTSTYTEAENKAGSAWEHTAAVTEAVETETGKVLTGVEIAARHCGRDGCAALAVLDRAKASAALWDRASHMGARGDRLWKDAKDAADVLEAARALWRAAVLYGRVEALNADLRILGARQPVATAARSSDARAAFRDRVAKDLAFAVDVAGQDADRLKAAVASELSARGVTLSDKGRVRVTGSCSMRRDDRPPREWVFVRYDVVLQATDSVQGGVVAEVGPVSDDASGRTVDQAFERAAWTIRTRHVAPFVDALFERMFGAGEEE